MGPGLLSNFEKIKDMDERELAQFLAQTFVPAYDTFSADAQIQIINGLVSWLRRHTWR